MAAFMMMLCVLVLLAVKMRIDSSAKMNMASAAEAASIDVMDIVRDLSGIDSASRKYKTFPELSFKAEERGVTVSYADGEVTKKIDAADAQGITLSGGAAGEEIICIAKNDKEIVIGGRREC